MARIPDPNALRRDRKDDAAWTVLTAGQRVDQVPEWPLVGQSEREVELWEMYWGMTQAILWKQNSQEIEVALFVRRLSEVELPGAGASLHTLLMRQMSSLLLTTPSMYKAKVKIASDVSKPMAQKANRSKDQLAIRERLKLVPKSR